jgi:hypothetical protein
MRGMRVSSILWGTAALIGVSIGWGAIAPADSPGTGNAPAAAVVDPMQEVTPEREAAAETFARLHHPELAELLTRLKAAAPKEYREAVRDLFRESERLAKLKARDPARYEIELDLWKVESRIHLATARLTMNESGPVRAELEELVAARLALRARLLQYDRVKVVARLEKLDADLKSLSQRHDELVAQEVERLLKSARTKATQAPRSRVNPNTKTSVNAGAPAPADGGSPSSSAPTPRSPERSPAAAGDVPQK